MACINTRARSVNNAESFLLTKGHLQQDKEMEEARYDK